ncbi:MAG: response regulator [Anaerolineales bacterium]
MKTNNEDQPITVLVVEDHLVVREGLCALINSSPGLKVIGEAADGNEAVIKAKQLNPDVILMDLVMPRKDGIQAIREIIHNNPKARVLVLSSYSGENIIQAVMAGALGYLLKESSSRELIDAINDVYRGKLSLHPVLTRRILRGYEQNEKASPVENQLSEREIDVLKLMAKGLSNQNIASELCLSEHTVAKHIGSILSKLNLDNRTQAALYALRVGLAKLE